MAEHQAIHCSTLGEVARGRQGDRTRHTADAGRVCLTCSTVLSVFNLADTCHACQLREHGLDPEDDTTSGCW